jgi:hypothetical protein
VAGAARTLMTCNAPCLHLGHALALLAGWHWLAVLQPAQWLRGCGGVWACLACWVPRQPSRTRPRHGGAAAAVLRPGLSLGPWMRSAGRGGGRLGRQ